MFDVKAYIASLGNPEDITELYLSGKNITHLEEDTFENLTRLKELFLSENQLTSLPPNLFENLTQLELLDLGDNQLTSLPPNLFKNLTQLKELDLNGNQLSYLPPNIFENLTQLKNLYLSGNQLNEIPRSIVSGVRVTGREEIEQRAQRAQAPRSPQRRTSPPRSTRQRTSPQRSPQQPFDVTCINDDDVLGIDDFTKGHKEFEAERRVIILNEGNRREGNCFGLKTLILSMMNTQEGKPTLGPWRAMNQMGSNATNRYFKLPYPNVWVDLEGMKKLLDGWKVLRLKFLREERIGSFFGVGTLHGHKEKIYTLAKVNSKYQGKNKPLSYNEVDNHTRIFLEIDENFIHLFSE